MVSRRILGAQSGVAPLHPEKLREDDEDGP
jgi:hypothetical protein